MPRQPSAPQAATAPAARGCTSFGTLLYFGLPRLAKVTLKVTSSQARSCDVTPDCPRASGPHYATCSLQEGLKGRCKGSTLANLVGCSVSGTQGARESGSLSNTSSYEDKQFCLEAGVGEGEAVPQPLTDRRAGGPATEPVAVALAASRRRSRPRA